MILESSRAALPSFGDEAATREQQPSRQIRSGLEMHVRHLTTIGQVATSNAKVQAARVFPEVTMARHV
jgi:hypothetical protein